MYVCVFDQCVCVNKIYYGINVYITHALYANEVKAGHTHTHE